MPGYTGIECTFECPYPSFGNDCQGYCSCSIELCDVARGCRSPIIVSVLASEVLVSRTQQLVYKYLYTLDKGKLSKVQFQFF